MFRILDNYFVVALSGTELNDFWMLENIPAIFFAPRRWNPKLSDSGFTKPRKHKTRYFLSMYGNFEWVSEW